MFYPDVKPDDDYEDILNKVFQSSIRTIEYTLAAIDMEEYRKLVEALSRASRVAFFAIGDAASVAQAGYYKFARSASIIMVIGSGCNFGKREFSKKTM